MAGDTDLFFDEAHSTSVYHPTAAQADVVRILTGQTGPRVRMSRGMWATVLELCAWREGR